MRDSCSIPLRFACVLLALAAGSIASQAGVAAAQKLAPVDLLGKAFDPFHSAAGRIVVLIFVRTDCPISNRYVPVLKKLSQEFRGKADFWLIYPDRSESPVRIRKHLDDFHLEIATLRDPGHTLVERSQATITPEAAVFDGSGRLLYHGRIDDWYEDFGHARPTPTTHELRDAIQSALKGEAAIPDHASAVGCYISDLK